MLYVQESFLRLCIIFELYLNYFDTIVLIQKKLAVNLESE